VSAFEKAMIDQINQPLKDVKYQIIGSDGVEVLCSCKDYLQLRSEEEISIKNCMVPYVAPKILDIASGAGRHSSYAKQINPRSEVTLVEQAPLLRMHCKTMIEGSTVFANIDDLPESHKFDIIMLMGLGLGVFGNEKSVRKQMYKIANLLEIGGTLLIEGGKYPEGDFYLANLEIKYQGLVDGPFQWGYATSDWLTKVLISAGLNIVSICPTTLGAPYFICQAIK